MAKQVHRRSYQNVFVLFAMAFFAIVSVVVMPMAHKGISTWLGLTSTIGMSSDSQFRFNNISGHGGFTGKSVSKRDNDKRDVNLERLEAGLATARELIREATKLNQTSTLEDADYVPHDDIYRNAYAFHRSYLLMESLFKIFVYEEGEPPIFHNGPCKNIYSMEGLFLSFMETDTKFRTLDPEKAHVYFLPFSVVCKTIDTCSQHMHTIIKGLRLNFSNHWHGFHLMQLQNSITECSLLLLTNLLLNGQNLCNSRGSNQGPIHLYI